MSKFRKLVENNLIKFKYNLKEAKILKTQLRHISNDITEKYPFLDYLPIYKNPTKNEINNLLNNSIGSPI